jgi:hypothetical protein
MRCDHPLNPPPNPDIGLCTDLGGLWPNLAADLSETPDEPPPISASTPKTNPHTGPNSRFPGINPTQNRL